MKRAREREGERIHTFMNKKIIEIMPIEKNRWQYCQQKSSYNNRNKEEEEEKREAV